MIISEILNSFLEINKINPHDIGEPARILASRTNYYKNIINSYDKTNPNDEFYKEIIKLHTKLVEVESKYKARNHMLHDSINFIERIITRRMKK